MQLGLCKRLSNRNIQYFSSIELYLLTVYLLFSQNYTYFTIFHQQSSLEVQTRAGRTRVNMAGNASGWLHITFASVPPGWVGKTAN